MLMDFQSIRTAPVGFKFHNHKWLRQLNDGGLHETNSSTISLAIILLYTFPDGYDCEKYNKQLVVFSNKGLAQAQPIKFHNYSNNFSDTKIKAENMRTDNSESRYKEEITHE